MNRYLKMIDVPSGVYYHNSPFEIFEAHFLIESKDLQKINDALTALKGTILCPHYYPKRFPLFPIQSHEKFWTEWFKGTFPTLNAKITYHEVNAEVKFEIGKKVWGN